MIWGAVCAKSFVEEQQHKKCCILRGAWHCVCVLSALWGIHEQQRRRQQQLAMSLPTTIAIVRVAKIRFSIAFVRFLCRMRWTRQSPEVLCNGGSKATFKFRSWRLYVTACVCVCVFCPVCGSWICNFATGLQTAAPRANNNCKLSTEKFVKVPYNQAPAGVYLSMLLPNAKDGVFVVVVFSLSLRFFSR